MSFKLSTHGDGQLHAGVNRATPLGGNPIDIFVRVSDIACFAMNAIGSIDGQSFALPFVNRSGAKMLARVSEFQGASVLADFSISDNQMARLAFFVARVTQKNAG